MLAWGKPPDLAYGVAHKNMNLKTFFVLFTFGSVAYGKARCLINISVDNR